MLRNYIKIALRNLRRQKAFSVINILGLAIGMTCSILILLWVQDELTFDRFHKNADRIYRISASLPDLDVHAAVTPAPLAEASRLEIPSIEKTVRVSPRRSELLQVGERMFTEPHVMYADSTFLQVFSFTLREGDAETAMLKPESILITESMAKKYFGNDDALGKTIQMNHKDDFTVTAVLDDIPGNSHLDFDFVIPMAFIARKERDFINQVWDNFNYYTYVLLEDKSATSSEKINEIDQQITTVYKANEHELKVQFNLQPLTSLHFIPNLLADEAITTNKQYVYILMVVAVFILVVACINFMNLSTARSLRRAKEVGLRKVAGAVRSQLVRQFLAESVLVSFLALLIAVLIVYASLPMFETLSGKSLSIDVFDGKIVMGLLGIALATGLFAGSYPAVFLSGFVPATVLKGAQKIGAGAGLFRNTLVVVQFVVSIALLIGTIVVYQQLHFIQERDLGYNKENLIYVRMSGSLWKNYNTFRTELAKDPLTANFAFVEDLPTNLSNATISVDWEGKDPASQPLFPNMAVDENFEKVFGVTLLSGRGFSQEFTADSTNLLVNEKALDIIGMTVDKAVGQPLSLFGRKGTIIGVVKDFNFQPVFKPIEPLIIRLDTWGGTAVVRAGAGETQATIAALKKICEELNPEYPFTYGFVDQDLTKLYSSEQQLGSLFNVFAGLAIFISCLGLYGLSAFLAERRTKEIGVRKALGASNSQIVYLLSRSFTRPVVLAMIIAAPLSWYGMSKWLEGFAYHVHFQWLVPVIAFVAALSVAWLTISFESIKAALANPTKSLRSE